MIDPEREVERLRALLEWVNVMSRKAMFTLPGTRRNRAIRDQALSEINARTAEFWRP